MKKRRLFILYIVTVFLLTACDMGSQDDQSGSADSSGESWMYEDTASEGSEAESTEESSVAPVTGVKEAIAAQFDVGWPFSEGFAVVGRMIDDEPKYNYVDTEGNLLLEEWVDIAKSFSEGLACVGYKVETRGQVDTRGRYRFGFIDTSGAMVIPAEIISTEYDAPCAFYRGYAEINHHSSEFGVHTNVIDREGNRLFDFPVDEASISLAEIRSGAGYEMRSGLSSEIYARMPECGYYRYNPWMKAYVTGSSDEVVLYRTESGEITSYLVDMSGKVIRTIDGNLKKIGDDYYTVSEHYSNPLKIYDRRWNLLDDKTYTSIKETEHGLFVATNKDRRYVLLNRYFTPLSDPYHGVEIVPDGYLCNVGMTYKWKIRGFDGTELFLLSKSLTDCFYEEKDCYGEEQYLENVCGIYIGTDKDSRQTTHVFAKDGTLLFTCVGVYKPKITLLTEDGIWLAEGKEKDMVFDQKGEMILELPYADCTVYGAGKDRIYLYAQVEGKGGYGSSKYTLLEMVYSQGTWSCIETETTGSIAFGLVVPSYRYPYAKNEESLILTEGLRHTGIADLELIDGVVLEEDATELTLVEDGLYIAVHYVKVDGRSVREAHLKYKGEDVSGAYENLDRISEDYIAFCKDGKWGYLRIER